MQVEIQPTDKFTFEFNGAEIASVYNALLKLPYAEVVGLISKIESEVKEQKEVIKG